ncbi:MAG TPA: AraC family transcriptional regulator [Rariglobus sp.]|jgi:AraC-like DNA-binding protein|nr:AraC family transcriptional regulator [Rariglobus sp.]
MPDPQIIQKLTAFLDKKSLAKIYVAGGGVTAPALAYAVNFPRISMPISGEDVMEVEQDGEVQTICVRPGEAVFIPPNCWNKPTWSKPVQVFHFLFGKKHIGISLVQHSGRANESDVVVKNHLLNAMNGPLADTLRGLMGLKGWSRPLTPLVQALVECCLESLLSTASPKPGKAVYTFESICLYVQQNFSFPITRESVARHFCIAPNHVSRLFQRQGGGMRFNDFLAQVRMERAMFLLKSHQHTIDEVAASCGFRDTSYFCHVFKRRTTKTPTEYRMSGRVGQS